MEDHERSKMPSNGSKTDEKAASLPSLQEMFTGVIDSEVVQLILKESENVGAALETLLTLTNNHLPSEKISTSVSHECNDSVGGIISHDHVPILRDRNYEDFAVKKETQFPPIKAHHDTNKEMGTVVSDGCQVAPHLNVKANAFSTEGKSRVNDSSVEMLKTSDNPHSTGKYVQTGKLITNPYKSPEMNDVEFSDTFNEFVKPFISGNSKPDEWKSVENSVVSKSFSDPKGHPPLALFPYPQIGNSRPALGTLIDRTKGTLSINGSGTSCTVDMDSKSIDIMDLGKKSDELKTAPLQEKNVNTVKQQSLTPSQLPPWPDSTQYYQCNYQAPPAPCQSNHPYPSYRPGLQSSYGSFSQGQNQGWNGNGGYNSPHTSQFQHVPIGRGQAFYGTSNQPDHTSPWNPGQMMSYQTDARQSHVYQPRQQGGFTRAQNQPGYPTSIKSIDDETPLPDGKVLVIMRGLPGSGKTTLAQKLKGPAGMVISTDDYFVQNGQYQFDGPMLGEAHEQNQKKARELMQEGVSPLIIDNTNTQAWEMRPYVSMANRLGYHVILKEPNTPWKWNIRELSKLNHHGVSLYGMKNMKDRYEHNLSVDNILRTNLDQKKKLDQQSSQLEANKPSGTHKPGSPSATPMASSEVKHQEYSPVRTKKNPTKRFDHREKRSEAKGVAGDEGKCDSKKDSNQDVNKLSHSTQMTRSPKTDSPRQNTKTKIKKKKNTDGQETIIMRSHGSRSPVENLEFIFTTDSSRMKDNEECHLSESDSCKNDEDSTEIVIPKPQRIPRKRERKPVISEPQSQADNDAIEENVCPPFSFIGSKLDVESLDSFVKRERVRVYSDSSVEVMSEDGSEGESQIGNDNIKISSFSSDLRSTRRGRDKEDESDTSEVASRNDSLWESSCDAELKKVLNPYNSSDDMAMNKYDEKHIPDAANVKKKENATLFVCPRTVIHKKTGPKVLNSLVLQNQFENDSNDRGLDDRGSVSQSEGITYDTGDVSDDPSFDHGSSFDADFVSSRRVDYFTKKKQEEAEREERSLSNARAQEISASEDCESELSGNDFLKTCFPEVDEQTLHEILAYHQGDVNKAVETILRSYNEPSANSSRELTDPGEQKRETGFQTTPSGSKHRSGTASLDPVPDPTLNINGNTTVQEYGQQNEGTAKATGNSAMGATTIDRLMSFQMTIEPAVALQLVELFGRIDGIDLEDYVSSEDLVINVDNDFAKLMYRQWRKTIRKSKGVHVNEGSTQQSPQSRKKPRAKKFDLQGPVAPSAMQSSQPTDLREIMDEQMALEQSRRDQRERNTDNSMAVILKRQKLYAMFPGVDSSALEELLEANKYELAPTVEMVQMSCNLQAKPTALIESREDKPNKNWEFIDIPEEQKTPFQAFQDPSYSDFRAEANVHYALRDECFKKAAVAFSQKQGQLAQFYASQGHVHTEKMKQANSRAAAMILEQKNAHRDPHSLDLHGLHVSEALQALEEKLNPQDLSMVKPSYISVVTGRGMHSKQGKARIKPAVLEYLQHNNYRFEERNAGEVLVFLK